MAYYLHINVCSFPILVDFMFTFYLLFGAAVAGRRHSIIAPLCFLNCWLFTLINYFFPHTQLANFVWLRALSLTIDIVHIDVGACFYRCFACYAIMQCCKSTVVASVTPITYRFSYTLFSQCFLLLCIS